MTWPTWSSMAEQAVNSLPTWTSVFEEAAVLNAARIRSVSIQAREQCSSDQAMKMAITEIVNERGR